MESKDKFWLCFIVCCMIVIVVGIAAVAIYNIEYLRLVKPETVPTLRWPSSGNL